MKRNTSTHSLCCLHGGHHGEDGTKGEQTSTEHRDGGCLRPSIFCIGLRLPFQISEQLTLAGNELLPLRGRGKEEKGRGDVKKRTQ